MANKYDVVTSRFYSDDGVDWDSSVDIRMLLLKDTASGPVFDAAHSTVQEILDHADNTEADDSTYSRQEIPDADRSVDLDGRTRQAKIANAVDFGDLDNEDIGAAVVYIHMDADDANNIPLSYHDDNFPATANGAGFEVGSSDAVVLETEADPS